MPQKNAKFEQFGMKNANMVTLDELAVHSCPLFRLQTHVVAKLASALFYCRFLFRNNNMATN